MLYKVAYYSDFIYINVYSSYMPFGESCGTFWIYIKLSLSVM